MLGVAYKLNMLTVIMLTVIAPYQWSDQSFILPRRPRSQGKSNVQLPGKIFVVENAIKFTIVNEPLKKIFITTI
jgi:hypothetical protein